MFPSDLLEVVASVPFPVSCLVASPPVIAEAKRVTASLGDSLVFGRGQLLGRVEPGLQDPGARLLGLLGAGVAPWLGRGSHDEDLDEDEAAKADPFDVIG